MGKAAAKRTVFEWIVVDNDGQVQGFDKEELDEALQVLKEAQEDAAQNEPQEDEEPYIYLRVQQQESHCDPFTGHIEGWGHFEDYQTWEVLSEDEYHPMTETLPRGVKGLWNKAIKKHNIMGVAK